MKCDKCSRNAIIFVQYSGAHLCNVHFNLFFEKRVKTEIRKQCNLKTGADIAIALSGGKDSTVALHMLYKIFGKRKDITFTAITVDEGIKNYREECIKNAKKNCKRMDIEHIVVSFRKKFTYTMDEIVSSKRYLSACAICGVLRRHVLNETAQSISAEYLATGLNLDDTVQSILMNIFRCDIEKLARLGPHKTIQQGFVPRIQPLRRIPEAEVMLYTLINNIEFYNGICPYGERAMRNKVRTMLNNLSTDMPSIKFGILNTYDALADIITERYPPITLNKCKYCTTPTPHNICKACEIIKRFKKSQQV
jgi:uncharacterized protein (TIGR00269 family)